MKIKKTNKLNEELSRLAELRQQKKELEAEIWCAEQKIIKYMEKNNTDTIEGNEHSVTYKLVVSNRIDTTELKKHHPKIAEKFTVVKEYMRFNFR